ncbi:hypothetical protein ACS0TY_011768 [Phlomoides rotata]
MTNRFYFEALDQSIRDNIRCPDGSKSDLPFGGKTIVLGGDFRHILPVIPKGSREDIVHAAINSSYLWDNCRVLRLTRNMRLQIGNTEQSSNPEEIEEFSNWILKVGDGKLVDNSDGFAEMKFQKKT